MLVIDNSEYMRNGDYPPSRFDAQTDAITTVFSAKVDSNPENTAGVMTMAGKSPEVLVTPTQDVGKILSALHNTTMSGSVDVLTAIQVAQLALKHRQNKNLRQRIIAFVGSPISDAVDERAMTRVGKKLKKNNVALDIVAYGEYEENEKRLKALVDAVQNNDNSHFLIIAPGSHLMSDILLSSPILRDPSEAGVPGGDEAGGSGGGNAFEFGFDPSLDPELALALRMSMEEEQARQRNAEAASSSAAAPAASTSTSAAMNTEGETTPKPAPKVLESTTAEDDAMDADENDPLLAQAIAMSTGGGAATTAASDADKDDEDMDGEEDDDEDGDDEDEEEGEDEEDEEAAIAMAIAMSMKQQEDDASASDPKAKKK